jgi:hypothetical protein
MRFKYVIGIGVIVGGYFTYKKYIKWVT